MAEGSGSRSSAAGPVPHRRGLSCSPSRPGAEPCSLGLPVPVLLGRAVHLRNFFLSLDDQARLPEVFLRAFELPLKLLGLFLVRKGWIDLPAALALRQALGDDLFEARAPGGDLARIQAFAPEDLPNDALPLSTTLVDLLEDP